MGPLSARVSAHDNVRQRQAPCACGLSHVQPAPSRAWCMQPSAQLQPRPHVQKAAGITVGATTGAVSMKKKTNKRTVEHDVAGRTTMRSGPGVCMSSGRPSARLTAVARLVMCCSRLQALHLHGWRRRGRRRAACHHVAHVRQLVAAAEAGPLLAWEVARRTLHATPQSGRRSYASRNDRCMPAVHIHIIASKSTRATLALRLAAHGSAWSRPRLTHGKLGYCMHKLCQQHIALSVKSARMILWQEQPAGPAAQIHVAQHSWCERWGGVGCPEACTPLGSPPSRSACV